MNSTEALPRRKGVYLGLAVVAIWLAFLAYAIPRMDADTGAASLDPPRHNPEVDYDWPLTDLDGKPVSFPDYKGRALFVNTWATWCGPCRAEMPSIVELSKTDALKDVAFLLVATDDERMPIRRFLAANPEMAAGRIEFLVMQEPNRAFASEAIPATFLVSPQGRVVAEQIGSRDWNSPEVVDLLTEIKDRK